MVTGIVVTHGQLGAELLRTAKTVIGDFPDCYAISNMSKSPQTVYDEICSIVEGAEGVSTIIFVDFFGGSCSHTCMRLETDRDNVVVISGVNLPMLLAFLNKREDVPFDNLPKEILDRSHSSIKILDPSKL